MSGTVRRFAPAKLNLFLEVLGKRPDGYHEVETVMQTISLGDRVAVRQSGAMGLSVEGQAAPTDERNLCWKAAELLRGRYGEQRACSISLVKGIPPGSGLGGASSDAAQTILALNELWALGLGRRELLEIGAEIGSDVPFFFFGRTCVCRGRGEIVETLDAPPGSVYLLVIPEVVVSTHEVYKSLDKTRSDAGERRTFDRNWGCGIASRLFNRLKGAALSAYPELREVDDRLRRSTEREWAMSGSGATFFYPFQNVEQAATMKRHLQGLGIGRLCVAESL